MVDAAREAPRPKADEAPEAPPPAKDTVTLRYLSGNMAGLVGEFPRGIPAEVAIQTGYAELVLTEGETPPPEPVTPVIEDLTPSSAILGSPSFTLHVLGIGFTPESVIFWNAAAEPTAFVSSGELTTQIDMSSATVAADLPVEVRTGPLVSNMAPFTLEAPPGP